MRENPEPSTPNPKPKNLHKTNCFIAKDCKIGRGSFKWIDPINSNASRGRPFKRSENRQQRAFSRSARPHHGHVLLIVKTQRNVNEHSNDSSRTVKRFGKSFNVEHECIHESEDADCRSSRTVSGSAIASSGCPCFNRQYTATTRPHATRSPSSSKRN